MFESCEIIFLSDWLVLNTDVFDVWFFFQQACGYEFTNKLHRMFTDVSISTSLNKEFLDFIQSKENVELGVNFSIMVLQVIVSSPEPKSRASFFLITICPLSVVIVVVIVFKRTDFFTLCQKGR